MDNDNVNTRDSFMKIGENLVLAILQDKSFEVFKILDLYPTLVNVFGGEPLKLAVSYNKRFLTRQLLARGADPKVCEHNGTSLILIAARNGFTNVLKDLLKHDSGFCQENAVIEAVERGMSASVETLANSGVNVTFGEDEALFRAHELKLYHVLKILVHYGANVDARDGQLLINSCEGSEFPDNMDCVTFLLECGADPNLRQGASLRACVRNQNAKFLEMLLNAGGEEAHVSDMTMSHSLKETLKKWRRHNRLLRLRRAIHSSYNRDTFVWQSLCRKLGNSNVHLVRQQVKYFGLEEFDKSVSLSNASKRQMCVMLAQSTEKMMDKDLSLESTDLSGTLLQEHPAWKIYYANGIAFNIIDLLRLLQEQIYICPYTRFPLPVEDIRRRGKFLEKVLSRDALNEFNLVEQVREMPLLTKEMELQTQLMNIVWFRLSYPPNIQIVIYGSDELLEEMVQKLYRITDDLYLYPMLTSWRKYDLMHYKGLRKKELFVKTIIEMVTANDEHTSVRLNVLNILFSHYRDDGTNRSGDPNDLLSFMLQEDESNDNLSSTDSPPVYTPSIVSQTTTAFDRLFRLDGSLPPIPEDDEFLF
jgi:hypothetical protein